MEMYEAKSLINYSYYKNMEDWEQTRFLGYVNAQINSKKKLKFTDIIKFEWDNKQTESNHEFDEKNYQRLKEKAQTILENNILN